MADPQQPIKVFLSHARPDADVAAQIHDYLTSAGVDVFRDTSDVPIGDNWDMAIEAALRYPNRRMVLLLSPHSMPYRKEVHREWFYFDQERKPIYPLSLAKCELHSRMYAYNRIDVATLGLQKALERLLAELARPFESPAGEADRIVVADSVVVEPRTPPETLKALLDAVRDPKGSAAFTTEQILKVIREYHPRDLTEYRLARIAEWSQPRYRLDNRFVELTLLIDQGEDAQGTRWAAPESRRRFSDPRDVLRELQGDPAVVLLGAPGSGKSTLLRRLQLDLAVASLRGGDDVVAYLVSLNAYRADCGSPLDWLRAEWAKLGTSLPKLDRLLHEGKVLLLLDAINEMPHASTAHYHERVGLWREFIQSIVARGNRALFTCRSLDYSASLSSKDLRVPQVVVQPMGNEQIYEFLRAYLPGRAEQVWNELKGTPQLDVARSPFFLRLMCDQVEDSGAIPRGRAGLFAGFVRQTLSREIAAAHPLFLPGGLLAERDHLKLSLNRWANPFELPERGALIPSLGGLAYAMQQEGLDADGAQIRIDYDGARALIGGEQAEPVIKAGEALGVLDEDLDDVLFSHQLLQEFFAARRLAADPNPDLVRVEWQIGKVTPSLDETLAALASSDPLPLLPQTGWEETTLTASAIARDAEGFIRALMPANLPLAARCAASTEARVSESLKVEIRGKLIERMGDGKADLRARIAAGLALGDIGDPRFERRSGSHGDYLFPPMAAIPSGMYPIGSDKYDDEKPHKVRVEEFLIGVFPVTNAEYALFIAAGGYEDERWWKTEAARAWRVGAGSTEGQKQHWRDNRKSLQSWTEDDIQGLVQANRATSEQAAEWIAIRNRSDAEFEEQLEAWFPPGRRYIEPEFWRDDAFNNSSQPVVGVCWHEARAYCVWLSAQGKREFRLPTEVEFEAAARGLAGREYAYGAVFDSDRSNTFESHIRRSTPVGIFDNAPTPPSPFQGEGWGEVQSTSPEGAHDLTGNAWSWTSSLYQSYPYDATDGRENAVADGRRVLRGGSWGHGQDNARAAYRGDRNPGARCGDVGFRLASPAEI